MLKLSLMAFIFHLRRLERVDLNFHYQLTCDRERRIIKLTEQFGYVEDESHMDTC